jgi:transposase
MAVGIDVSKSSLDITVLDSKEQILHNVFKNCKEDILKLSDYLSDNRVKANSQIVIESTGDYHLLVSYILGKKFNIQIINPLISKRIINTNIRKVKSDKADSLALAQIGLQSRLNEHLFNKKELQKRKLVAQIDTLEKHRASLKLSLNNTKKTFRDFEFNTSGFTQIESAISSLGRAIEQLQEELAELIERKACVKSLASIPGVSEVSATLIVAMLEDRKFANKRSLVAYSGLDVSVKESGLWKGKSRLTKRGNSFLRKYLIRIAWGLLMHNEQFKKYGRKFKERGRKYREVQVIMARKFLHMLYGAMSNNADFSTDFMHAY